MAPRRKAHVAASRRVTRQSASQQTCQESDGEGTLDQVHAALISSSSKSHGKEHDVLKQQHAQNVTKTRKKIDEAFADQKKSVKSYHKELAGALLELLARKRELEAQMLTSVKTLYRAYESMNMELGTVVANKTSRVVDTGK